MKHISPTFMCIIPMYLRRLTTFTKTLPQISFHLYFLLFLFRSGAPPMTLLTAGALTDPRLPATASNVCTTDARLGGVGPVHLKQKSWLRRWHPLVMWSAVCSALQSQQSLADSTKSSIFAPNLPTPVHSLFSRVQARRDRPTPYIRCLMERTE